MKINRKVLSMALGVAALPLGLAAANESIPLPKSLSNAGRISDNQPAISNSTVSSQRPLMQVAPQSNAEQPVFKSAGYAAQSPEYDQSMMMNSPSYQSGSGCSDGCSSDCTSGSCDGYSCGTSSSYGTGSCGGSKLGCGLSNMLGWGEVEALLWWGPNSQNPPLVSTGPRGQQTTAVFAGGINDPLGGQMQTGMRGNFGLWLDQCQTMGVGGRVFGIFSDSNRQTFSSDGSTTLGVPYFNAATGELTDYLVALDTQGNGVDTGSVIVDNKTNFFAAEAYGRFLMAKSGASRADLIGGYSFARLDDTIGLQTRSVDGITGGTIDGTVTETNDRFSTKNTFHGGHVGFTTDTSRGRWTLSTLGKVAMGNMNQQARVSGNFSETPPGGATTRGNIGLLAQNSNIGAEQRNLFTFIPEAGAKLRYCLTSKLKFNVGYTFLFFPDVAMAGGLIDPTLDLSNLQTPTVPFPRFSHDTYYLHGLDLGLSYQF